VLPVLPVWRVLARPKGIDGVMGDGTRSAIMAFRAANGMEQTGVIDDAFLQAVCA
jgi:peptidoglycan hydrolase-like protein with peptidoglycan-binding domain